MAGAGEGLGGSKERHIAESYYKDAMGSVRGEHLQCRDMLRQLVAKYLMLLERREKKWTVAEKMYTMKYAAFSSRFVAMLKRVVSYNVCLEEG